MSSTERAGDALAAWLVAAEQDARAAGSDWRDEILGGGWYKVHHLWPRPHAFSRADAEYIVAMPPAVTLAVLAVVQAADEYQRGTGGSLPLMQALAALRALAGDVS